MSSGLAAETPPASGRAYPLWHYIVKLLRLRWTITYNGLRRAKPRGKVGYLVLILFGALLFAFAFIVSRGLLGFLGSPRFMELFGDATPILQSIPVVVLGFAFIAILMTSFGVLLQALYLAGDMEFLLSAPVPIRAVFVSKLLQAILPNFGLIALFGLPVLYGLGVVGGYHYIYYPLVLLVLAALSLAAAGLSALLVMFVARIVPPRRVAEVLALIGAFSSLLCSQSGVISNRIRYENIEPDQVQNSLALLSRLNTPWSPLAWPGRGLAELGQGHWAAGLGLTALSLALAGGIFLVSLQMAERWYYTGWAGMQVGGRKKKSARPLRKERRGPASLLALPWLALPAPLRALMSKDFMLLRRDLRNLSQVITPFIFGLIYAVIILTSGSEAPVHNGEAPGWIVDSLRTVVDFGSIGIAIFVGWGILSRLALTAFSMEGKSYWLVKSAPVKTVHLLLAKYLVAYTPAVALGWIFILIMAAIQRADPAVILYGLPVVALTFAGTAGVNLAMGVKGTKLDWDDPRKMTQGTVGCLNTIISMGIIPLLLAFFFLPPIAFALLKLPMLFGWALGIFLGSTACLAMAIVPLWLVRSEIARIGEK